MGYLITDYFEANRQLSECIREVETLKAIGKTNAIHYRHAEDRLKSSAERVDELVEIFTWETTETDNIRRAFITQALNIETMLLKIQKSGMYPDPYNGTDYKFQLADEIITSFREGLKTTGRYCPRVNIKTRKEPWNSERLCAYLQDMQRQLKATTFDNLLEALRYFESSTAMLFLVIKVMDEKG